MLRRIVRNTQYTLLAWLLIIIGNVMYWWDVYASAGCWR